jgi:hypothetical protein
LKEDDGGVDRDFEECGKLHTDVSVTEVLPCENCCPVSELVESFTSLSSDLTVATASTTSGPAEQHTRHRGFLRPSSIISNEEATTLGIKNKKKAVRFVEGLKDNGDVQTKISAITEYPEGSEQLRDLIQQVHNNPILRDAIELLSPRTLSEIAYSLDDDPACQSCSRHPLPKSQQQVWHSCHEYSTKDTRTWRARISQANAQAICTQLPRRKDQPPLPLPAL